MSAHHEDPDRLNKANEDTAQSASSLTANSERLRQDASDEELHNIVQVTISTGVIEYLFGENSEDLMKRADDALYISKHPSRKQVSFLKPPISSDKRSNS